MDAYDEVFVSIKTSFDKSFYTFYLTILFLETFLLVSATDLLSTTSASPTVYRTLYALLSRLDNKTAFYSS